MRSAKPILTLALLAGLGGGALAQTSPGQTTATPPQQGRPQSPSSAPHTPQPAANDMRDYTRMLRDAEEQLRQSIGRSAQEPAQNQQNAMTPARMDMKAAAQQAHQVVRRAPPALQGDTLYERAERDLREALTPLSMPLNLEDSNGAAERVLAILERFRTEVERRLGAG